MANLTFTERSFIEAGFRMRDGYVLGFTNRTFQEFVMESVSRNIYEHTYSQRGESKANRLRAFIAIEQDHIVAKLISDLTKYALYTTPPGEAPPPALHECQRIADRLKSGAVVLEPIVSDFNESTFQALTKSVRHAVDNNEPEEGIDRLHTYFVSYVRKVCKDNGIETTRDEPAHSVLGKYVKFLKISRRAESDMTLKILIYAQSTMDAFNRVRNEQSLAHPNPILNYRESLLIFNHVVSIVNFIRSVEEISNQKMDSPQVATPRSDELAF